jgi:hypothetical protein
VTDSGSLWTPGDPGAIPSSAEVVASYRLYLEVNQPESLKPFDDRCHSNRDAGAAEAIMFSWLRTNRLEPTPATPGARGPDFLCQSSDGAVLFEVTTLDRNAVSARSGWPDTFEDTSGSFAHVTKHLSNKARSKSGQLANQEAPRILVVCCFHVAAAALLGTIATQWFIAEPRISIPIGVPNAEPTQVTNLKHSAFFTFAADAIVTRNRSISAILLVAVDEEGIVVTGLLHPDPVVAFDYHILRQIPFLRAEWPMTDKFLRTEWVIASPSSPRFLHSRIDLTNRELRAQQP